MNATTKTLISASLVLFFLLSGCTLLSNYGKLRPESGFQSDMTIETLRENWNDFHVYYAGLSFDNAAGILFDPKNDDRDIIGKNWIKVEKQKDLSSLITWLDVRRILFRPRLSRILGPNGETFGYIYSPYDHATMKALDKKTLYVYDMEIPEAFRPGFRNL